MKYNLQDYESRMNLLGELYRQGEFDLGDIIKNKECINLLKKGYMEITGDSGDSWFNNQINNGFWALEEMSKRFPSMKKNE